VVKAKQPRYEWLDVPDIDADCTLVELAQWVLECLQTAELNLARHKDWQSFRLDKLQVVVQMAYIEGKLIGSSEALKPMSELKISLSEEVVKRLAQIALLYEQCRQEWIEKLARDTLAATQMWRALPQGGRAVKLVPNYEDPATTVEQMIEFHIAVQLFEKKKQTGKMSGLSKLVNEAIASGSLTGDGNETDRIKRLVQSMWETKDIYLPPSIRALRHRAAERVKNAKDFMTSLG
jgi:hypothetical protein